MRSLLFQPTVSGEGPGGATAAAVRLLLIAVAAIAIWLGGQPVDPRLAYLGAAYIVIAAVLWWLGRRLARGWLAYPAALADVGAVTALLILSAPTPLPLWVLYLLPVIGAGVAGPGPAASSAAMAAVGYLGAVWLTAGTIPLAALWPVAVLAAAAVAVSGLFAGRLAEQQERIVWQEIAASRPLAGMDEPEEAAAAVVERARRLARADRAWLWWYEEGAEPLRIGARAGPVSEELVSEELAVRVPVTSALPAKLGRGPVPLAELDRRWVDLSGEMLALRLDQAGPTVALLAVAWDRPHRDRALLRERLRVFAPWAAEALSRSQARAAMAEASRRERVLRQAAREMAETLDREAVWQAAMKAVREGVNAAVSLVERPSGRIVAGDAEVAEVLTRLAVDSEAIAAEADTSSVHPPRMDHPWVTSLQESLAMVAWRPEPLLEERDTAWLEELAGTTRVALRRCAEHDRLRQDEQLLRASVEGEPAPVAIWNASGELTMANATYRSLDLGDAPPSEVPASGVSEEEVTVGDPPRSFVVLTTLVAEGRYVLSLYREVTREREALRAKDELISMVGHELRNPLTSIQGYSQMMGKQLGVVQEQVDHLNRMIGDFVEASKLESAQLPLKHEGVDMAEVARTAVQRFRGGHQGRTVRMELAMAPPVEGDPVRLGQVLDNLLTNAAKYSPKDREIVLTLGVSGDRVLLSVQDQGEGIAPEHIPHLFERFYRVPSAEARRVKGLGLGLSIVRDIVAAHGGRVWAESAGLGQGSTFWVSLPAATAAEGRAPNSQVV